MVYCRLRKYSGFEEWIKAGRAIINKAGPLGQRFTAAHLSKKNCRPLAKGRQLSVAKRAEYSSGNQPSLYGG
jgi:hypothetical protein